MEKMVLTILLETSVDFLSTQIIVRKIILLLFNGRALPFNLTVTWTFIVYKTVHKSGESHPNFVSLYFYILMMS